MKKIFRSRILMWVSILALLVVTVGGTLALMATQANTVTNQFTVADVDTELEENLTSGKQAWVQNNGDSPVYVRARIMVSGVNGNNVEVVGKLPDLLEANKVYLVMENQEQWVQASDPEKDDFYYYLGVVQPNGVKTSNLLEKVALGSSLATDNNFLANFSVTIYHESVLAIGTGADLESVQNAFKAAGAEIA